MNEIEIWRHAGYIDEIVYNEEQLSEYIQDELQKELSFFVMIDANWR